MTPVIRNIKPRAGRVIVLALHESLVGRASGLLIPEGVEMGNRWYGVVVANNSDADLQFGDLVELGRWQGGSMGRGDKCWITRPLHLLAGVHGTEARGYWVSDDGTKQVEVRATDKAAIIAPSQILFRIARIAEDYRETGLEPVADRVMVRCKPQGEREENGLVLPDIHAQSDECAGTVEAVGSLVDDVQPGDCVVFDPGRGTRVYTPDCMWAFVPESAVLTILDSAENVEWVGGKA